MMFNFTIACLLSSTSCALAASAPASGIEEEIRPRQNGFVHPGILIDSSQIDYIATKVAQSVNPWATAYSDMMAHSYASRTTPTPVPTVECGSYSNPDVGCTDERDDAMTAYLNALAWISTGGTNYAARAIDFMNSWASTIKAHTNSNAPLQAGWVASVWTRTAEIIRHTGAGWYSGDVTKFELMLRNVYLPQVEDGAPPNYNGNWDLVMLEAVMNIGVFLDDSDIYDTAMDMFLDRVPAYIYLTSDGELPKTCSRDTAVDTESQIISFWQGQSIFNTSGLSQETCRDFEHTGYGLASISHVAETSRIQGRDLFKEDTGTRLRYALEFHSKYHLGEAKPSWLCPDKDLSIYLGPVTEVGFNALSTRLGISVPYTEEVTMEERPAGTDRLFVGWETLTNFID